MRKLIVILISIVSVADVYAEESIADQWSVIDVGFGIKPSFGIAPDGTLHVSGMTEKFSGGVLWHASADTASSLWTPAVVAQSFFYGPGDMAVANDGTVHIAVHDHVARDAMHVEISVNGQTQVRHIVTPTERDGWDNALAFDSTGTLYQSTVNPNGPGVVDSLSINRFDAPAWTSELIVGSKDFTHSLGTSIAFDAENSPHILFTPATSQTEPTELLHAFRGDDGRWAIAPVVSGGIRGRFSSLTFDQENRGHAAWLDLDSEDPSQGTIRYGLLNHGEWTVSTVDTLSNVQLGPSGGLKTVTLELDAADNPHIAYGDTRNIWYAFHEGDRWRKSVILSAGNQRYNGLSIIQLHPITDQPYVVFWEPDETHDGVVRMMWLAREGDFNRDGLFTSTDIDLLSLELNREHPDLQYDLTADGIVDSNDHLHWQTLAMTFAGDADLDGRFASSDLVVAFQAGRYEIDLVAGWSEGDWDGDLRFTSTDLIRAFEIGIYEDSLRAVPESGSSSLILLFAIAWTRRYAVATS